MSELRELLELWNKAHARGEEVVLVTVVSVEGSSYRKPGARILISKSGQRSGMVSGGCLEAEVSRKAWWLTEDGPSIQRYGTFFDEDNPSPQSLGCGGTVHLLLERGDSAAPVLETIRTAAENRFAFALLTVIRSDNPQLGIGARLAVRENHEILSSSISLEEGCPQRDHLLEVAAEALALRRSNYATIRCGGNEIEFFVEYIAAPPALFVFGAGDDAIPLVELAYMMGWHITVADARSHLATAARFSRADQLVVLKNNAEATNGRGSFDLCDLALGPNDSAVIMTHSYMQDRALLRQLLPLDLSYLGILGPRLRTSRLLTEVLTETGMTLEECTRKLHSPVGIDIGANNPAGIALSIVAEVQASLHARSGAVARQSFFDFAPTHSAKLHA